MSTVYRYILEKGSKKHRCPCCIKKRFVKYIDVETDEYLPDDYGRCDRESKCGYHLNPYENNYAEMIREQEQGKDASFKLKKYSHKSQPQAKKETAFIPVSELKNTLKDYEKNIFIQNLLNNISFPFKIEDIEKIISLYRLGTINKTGAICFPFIDENNNIRAVQEKIFDATNHTDKNKKYYTSWLHSRLQYNDYKNKPLPDWLQAYLNNDTKVSCLFGTHLLSKYPLNPVALVEAPKTAIYGTLYFGFPEEPTNLIWLAVFNLSSLTFDKCKVLKGRDVYLFPDASKDGTAFKKWSIKASDIESKLSGTYFKVSDLLEQLAPDSDKENGNDLADYLINKDWRNFRPKETEAQPEVMPVKNDIQPKVKAINLNYFSDIKKEQNEDWSEDVAELENYFRSFDLPTYPVKLNRCSTINDCSLFIESHLATVNANNGKRTFLPYVNRLQELKKILTINSN